MLTIAVINNLVVFFWRGTWTALDLLLYPDDLEISAIVSLGVACCFAVILYATQFKIAAICRRVEKCECSFVNFGFYQQYIQNILTYIKRTREYFSLVCLGLISGNDNKLKDSYMDGICTHFSIVLKSL